MNQMCEFLLKQEGNKATCTSAKYGFRILSSFNTHQF